MDLVDKLDSLASATSCNSNLRLEFCVGNPYSKMLLDVGCWMFGVDLLLGWLENKFQMDQ